MLGSLTIALTIWIGPAHRAVATTAYELLTPTARTALDSLLPRDSFITAGTWADDIRRTRPRTARWHYVNIPLTDSVYRPDVHCPRGDCVVEVIDRFQQIVGDRRVSKLSRIEALKFLIHFVADLHQPLHTTDNGDRGGNDRIVQLPDGARKDLHALWDAALVPQKSWGDTALLHRIRAVAATNEAVWSSGSTTDWTLESHSLGQNQAYCLPETGEVDQRYLDANTELAIQQLAKASVRLATVLNEAMAGI